MKNIKIIGSSILLASAIAFVSASAMAKTEGNLINFNLSANQSKHEYLRSDGMALANYPEFSDTKPGFGFAYKYALNFNDVFIRPGVFFDYLGLKAKDADQDNISTKHRYGATVDLGYDILNNVAIYATAGLAKVNYDTNWISSSQKKSESIATPIYGAGLAIYPRDNISINFEYNYQGFDAKTPGIVVPKARTNLNTIRLGFGYQF